MHDTHTHTHVHTHAHTHTHTHTHTLPLSVLQARGRMRDVLFKATQMKKECASYQRCVQKKKNTHVHERDIDTYVLTERRRRDNK